MSTLRSCSNNTMRGRGVDVAILGVDIAILGVEIGILGVDVAILGVDIAILGIDIANLRRQEKRGGATRGGGGRHSGPRCRHSSPRCRYSNPRCRHSNPWCRHSNPRSSHSKPEEAREKGRRYRGREEGEVSRVRRLEAGWTAREFGGIKNHRERGTPCYKPFLGVRSGRGLGCRGTLRRSVRRRWVVPSFNQVIRNHQWSGTKCEAPIGRGADRERA